MQRAFVCVLTVMICTLLGICAPIARDYEVKTPILPVSPAILTADDRPWEQMPDGTRRKAYFNDRLTVMLFEIGGPQSGPMKTHHHPHDQITYVIEGTARVKVGDDIRIVGPGSVYIAPSNVEHGAQVLSKRLVLLETFTPTREDFRK